MGLQTSVTNSRNLLVFRMVLFEKILAEGDSPYRRVSDMLSVWFMSESRKDRTWDCEVVRRESAGRARQKKCVVVRAGDAETSSLSEPPKMPRLCDSALVQQRFTGYGSS